MDKVTAFGRIFDNFQYIRYPARYSASQTRYMVISLGIPKYPADIRCISILIWIIKY
jgi:hypothetical protein